MTVPLRGPGKQADLIAEQHARIVEKIRTGQGAHQAYVTPPWQADPFLWARERLRVHLIPWSDFSPKVYAQHEWDGSPEPLHSAALGVAAGQNVAISSCTGGGKTFLGAVMVLWFLDQFEQSLVITVAPKKEQLTLNIWKELNKLWPKFQRLHPKAVLDTLRIRMNGRDDTWGAVGFVCGVGAEEDVANRARGFHNEHMLQIFEETPGIDPAILEAFKLTCTAPHNLRVFFGNPDSNQDALARVSQEPNVRAIRLSGLDHPNVVLHDAGRIPGAISEEKIAEWAADPKMEEQIFLSRSRGLTPQQGKFALIRLEWLRAAVERAAARGAELSKGDGALGVDVANSEDGDRAATAYGRGRLLMEVRSFRCPDANAWAREHVWPMISSELVDAKRVGVDTVGVGVGAFNELKRLGAPCQSLAGGVWDLYLTGEEEFPNLRSQMYWQFRVDLTEARPELQIGLCDDRELFEDLTAPKWETRNGKIHVESKEDFTRRLKRSPDKGDAVVYWNWVRRHSRIMSMRTGISKPVAL